MGMSQERLAEGLGLTFQQIQKYERGANRISASKLFEAATVLGAPVDYFFEGLEAHDQPLETDDKQRVITEFLRTNEGMELTRSFPRISQVKLRRRILDLVRILAEPDEES